MLVPKRNRDEETAESDSKRVKLGPSSPILNAIELVGLTEKAVMDGRHNLSLLTGPELVSVLDKIGTEVSVISDYTTLSQTAATLRDSSFEDINLISSSVDTQLPVIGMRDLYVRQAYLDLYDVIDKKFNSTKRNYNNVKKHVAVTGTAGIGKSVFLVYFTIRILATSSENNPPIIIIQRKEDSRCFAFGGLETVREGDLKDFEPFLELPGTWYLVDSSPNPLLPAAKTIIAASPKTLYSEASNSYQDIDKRISWRYYMAPWTLEELEVCRKTVRAYEKRVSKTFLKELYNMIGGVPRYVLERPKDVLDLDQFDHRLAKQTAYERVQRALDNIKDPLVLMQYFAQGKDSLVYSSRLLHRWPKQDHNTFYLEWASEHIAEEVRKTVDDTAWQQILTKLVKDTAGDAKGPMFELYVRHIFRREGGSKFQVVDLQDDFKTILNIPTKPTVEFFDEIKKGVARRTLYVPKSSNFACVDMLISPDRLLQVTVSKRHPIKSEPFKVLLNNLVEKKWIKASKDAKLIFVVPRRISADFEKQKYENARKVLNDDEVPALIKDVKQYVLWIDLEE
ncbi:hypothetical protein BGX21_005360 [Mortierella sp. AD011]|nr:hypothetical protein BGX21_005360 [Mortierella sp. AD011]